MDHKVLIGKVVSVLTDALSEEEFEALLELVDSDVESLVEAVNEEGMERCPWVFVDPEAEKVTACPVCGNPQRRVRGGLVCKEGHGF